ncbi:polyprotein [Plakobranchus ocellatus]|uniref:Polyprotein n=1 Tax=Plakobranchus ocellatus TaxID=259542 RepID=A0AAV4ATZ2_9GAST|nr:polyprotein [Plakobranchus ocellatus]
MPSRSNYHSQRYEYASAASMLFNKSDKTSQHQLNIVSGKINGTDCTVLRDTGCTCVGVRQSLLKPNDFTNDTATCQMFDGSEKKFRKATEFIETPFFTGKVTGLALANPVVDVILGNTIGVGDQPNLNEQSPTWKDDPDSDHKAHAYVSTRAQKSTADNVNPNNSGDNKQAEKNENTSYKTAVSELKREDLEKEQQSDPTLETVRAKAKNNNETYYTYNGIIFRRTNNKSEFDQIVLPKSMRQEVLQARHDSPIAGHLGINATKKRVCSRFSWPSIIRDSNGMVERFNGSLKTMLRKLCTEKPQTWDKMIPAVLFAYREIPNVTAGYPPFMLMYGRRIRGPADMIADQYIGQQNTLKEAAFVHEYTKNLQREITDSLVMKKDGAIRLCLDFRKLNKITIFDAQPIPTLDELLGKMKGAKFFTKCDLTKGYWQIPMHEDSKAYTAFQTTQGLMEFNYMPFGLSTAACTFQRAMLDTLGKLPFVASYFDDVFIFSKSWEEHLEHIEKTVSALREAGFTVKPSKTIVGFWESATVHQGHPCLYSLRAKIGVSDPGKILRSAAPSEPLSPSVNSKSHHTHTHQTFNPTQLT